MNDPLRPDGSQGPPNPFQENPPIQSEVNPFRSPAQMPGHGQAPAGVDPILFHGQGYVRQVTFVAVFMIVHGLLVSLMAAILIFTGAAFSFMPPEAGDADFERMRGPMSWGFGIFGGLLLILGLLLVIAAIRNLSFRGRTMGIVAIGASVLTVFTVYCAPTAIALAIWGLIVYLNPAVSRAFELREAGTSAADIRTMVRK